MVVGSVLVEAVRESLDEHGKATPRTVTAVTDLVASCEGVRGEGVRMPARAKQVTSLGQCTRDTSRSCELPRRNLDQLGELLLGQLRAR